MIQQAVILNLIVIGEAAVQIETEFPGFCASQSLGAVEKIARHEQ